MNVTLKQYRQLLGTYLAPQRRRVLVLGLVMAADLVLQLALPRVVQTFIDSAIAGVALQTLMLIGVGYLFVSIAENFTWVGWQYIAQNIGLIATNRIRTDLTLHCLKLDMSFHNARTPGEMIERVDGDVTRAGQLPVELSGADHAQRPAAARRDHHAVHRGLARGLADAVRSGVRDHLGGSC